MPVISIKMKPCGFKEGNYAKIFLGTRIVMNRDIFCFKLFLYMWLDYAYNSIIYI